MLGRSDEDRAARASAVRSLKLVAAELLGASEDDTVVVNELRCTEPGCPPLETVVALLRPGEAPRQVKIHKSLLQVTENDLRHAIAGPAHEHRAEAEGSVSLSATKEDLVGS